MSTEKPMTATAHNAALTGEIQIHEVSRMFGQMTDEALKRFETELKAARSAIGEKLAATAILPTQEAFDALTAQKDVAYTERNRLVAFLAALFPSSLERHQPEDDPNWEPEWKNVVYIDLPTGQAGWHIHDSELPLFDHVPGDQGRKWDGHTTQEKYRRLAGLGVQLRSPEVSDLVFRLRVTLQQTLEAKLALSQDCWRCRYCGGQRWESLTRQDDPRYDPDQAPMFCRECGAQMQYMRWDDASQNYVLSNAKEECTRIFGTAEAKESEASS